MLATTGGAMTDDIVWDEPDSTSSEVAQPPKRSRWETRTIALIALALSVITLGTTITTNNRLFDVEQQIFHPSLYSPPRDLDGFIATIQESVVVIECKESQGSGWVIDLGAPGDDADPEDIALDKKFPTEVITNHHVIEECVKSPGKVKATAFGETYDAWLYSWDKQNDLALVAIKQKVPALEIALEPKPGYWVMALGTPYGLEGSISLGNVINTAELEVVSSAPLNSGNSGGPLVNSRGRVVGVNSWVMIGDDYPQDWNVAVAIPAMCLEIVDCGNDPRWTWGRADVLN